MKTIINTKRNGEVIIFKIGPDISIQYKIDKIYDICLTEKEAKDLIKALKLYTEND